jgi:hypothetical protein
MVTGFGVIGAALGALVAVVTHFLSHTLPSHYEVGFWQLGDTVNVGSPPVVHPSWEPALVIAVGIGAAVGLGAGIAARRAGLRIGRPAPPT